MNLQKKPDIQRSQHSRPPSSHCTPPSIVRIAYDIMGGTDLDPASCAAANRTVGARAFFTVEDSGLSQPWFGRVFLNPPSGKIRGKSQVLRFWEKLIAEYCSGNVYSAVFLGLTPALLYLSQGGGHSVLDYPLCLPKKRIAFLAPNEAGELVPQGAPQHNNFISFLPPRDADYHTAIHRFYWYTRDIGWCGFPRAFVDEDFSQTART